MQQMLFFTLIALTESDPSAIERSGAAPRTESRQSAPAGTSAPTDALPTLIDLSADPTRHVIVDREEGQYLGHPTTLLLEDGMTILCVYPRGHGRGEIMYKRSTDGGRSWGERLPTPESWKTSKETPTLHRVVDAQGVRRVILFSGLYPVRMAESADDGASWSELKPVGAWGGIVTMASVVTIGQAPGSYLALFHDDGRFLREGGKAEGTFTLLASRSVDGGRSWSEPESFWSGTAMHLCEPGAVRDPKSGALAILLRENRRVAPSQVMVTRDEGKSWSAPQPLHAALWGDRHVARVAPDGRIVVSFREVTPRGSERPTQGDWMVWVGSFDDLLTGGAGTHRVRLMDNRNAWDCAYPGLELLPEGTFVATTYGHWDEGKPPYVVSVRFTLAEFEGEQ